MPQCKVIAIANQKGGVGKTTTTFSLGVALSKMGKKVLLIDTDPQGDLTTYMGWYDQNDYKYSIANLMDGIINDKPINPEEAILHHKEQVDLIPSNLDLSATELSLATAMSRETTIKNAIADLKYKYDYIIIDCMPSLAMLTINALAASDSVIIPVQSQYLAARGMTSLIQNINRINRYINPNLKIDGILLTLVDRRTNLSKEIKEQLESNYGNKIKIFETQIPIAVKTAESSALGKSIFEYDSHNKVADSYYAFAKEVIDCGRTKTKDALSPVR